MPSNAAATSADAAEISSLSDDKMNNDNSNEISYSNGRGFCQESRNQNTTKCGGTDSGILLHQNTCLLCYNNVVPVVFPRMVAYSTIICTVVMAYRSTLYTFSQ